MNERKSLETRIKAIDETVAAEREREWVVMANLGQAVYEKGASGIESLDEAVKSVENASSEIRDLEESLRKLLADEERRNAILEERKSLNVELRNLKNREAESLDELGRAAWQEWESGRQVGAGMEEALDVLIKAERRVHDVEDAVYRRKSEPGKAASFFSKGRDLLLTGRKRTAAAALDRLWAKAGAAVREGVPAEALGEGKTAAPIAALKAMDERKEEIRLRTAALTAEKQGLDEAMDAMPGRGGVKKRASWIESALETHRIVLDDSYRDLGEAWLEKAPAKAPAGVISDLKAERDAIAEGIEKLLADKGALEAHLEYLDLLGRRDAVGEKASALDAEIKERQARLKKLKKELSGLEKDLKDRKESLPDLPAEPEPDDIPES